MSLYQYFLAIDDVETLDRLLYTLTGQVKDALQLAVLNLVRGYDVTDTSATAFCFHLGTGNHADVADIQYKTGTFF